MAYGDYGRWFSDSHLEHFGIPGQKWGIRRYQNQDGTLTEEGKRRYYDSLSPRQKKQYDQYSPRLQEKIERKMESGKSFSRAQQEMTREERTKTNLIAGPIMMAGYAAYMLYLFPSLRKGLKAGMLKKVSQIVNTKAVGGTLQRAKKMIDHLKMRKAGAIFVKAKDVWISGDKLGA